MTAETLWKTLRLCWIDANFEPPDVILHDARQYFMAVAFEAYVDMLHIKTKAFLVESANSMTILRRYHAQIRRSFNTIMKKSPEIEDEEGLKMAVKSLNDSAGPDGLTRKLLVLAPCKISVFLLISPRSQRFNVLSLSETLWLKCRSNLPEDEFCGALHARNGPDVTDIHTTPLGVPALVYRREKVCWDGLYSLLEMNDEDVIALTSKGAKTF